MKPSTEYLETYFEIVKVIILESESEDPQGLVKEVEEEKGLGGLYELAEDLADKFHGKYEGVEWEGGSENDFFDTMEEFIQEELY